MAGETLLGIGEGTWNAIVDMFKGVWDLGVALLTNPVGLLVGLGSVIAHPVDTGKYLCDAFVTSFTRDVINGDARSRAKYFSYGIVSIIGLKGIDKLGKVGKLGKLSKLGEAGKADGSLAKIAGTGSKGSLPYNVLKTDKLKEFITNQIETHYRVKKEQVKQLLGSTLGKAMQEQVHRATEKAKSFSDVKNVLNPKAFQSFFDHTYQAVIKSPLAKTTESIKSFIQSGLEKIGDIKIPTRIEVNSLKATNGMNVINVSAETTTMKEIISESKVINKLDGMGDVGGTHKETVSTGMVLDDVPRLSEIEVTFKLNPKHDSEEFARQLKAQEEGMNKLTVDKYLKNRARYIAEGRAIEGNAAQQAAREEALSDKIEELQNQGLSFDEAEQQASEWMKTQAALHNPDQIAGGNPLNIGGMGDSVVNKSIGSQWKYRIDIVDEQIREIAKNMTHTELKNTYLNVRLTH